MLLFDCTIWPPTVLYWPLYETPVVRRMTIESPSAGNVPFEWDGRDARGNMVPSGVYFYRMENTQTAPRKMVLLK